MGAVNFRDIPMPRRIASLPRDKHGHPVPKFVAWIDGVPDFRVVDSRHLEASLRFAECWICGTHIGATVAFVLGPMCGITRTAPEPPSHVDCADYAARACPFLATPAMRRRETGLPDDLADPAGIMIRRNPGVALVWITKHSRSRAYRMDGGWLFNVGDSPLETRWYAQGRPATRAEVLASIDSGLPELRTLALAGRRPEREMEELARSHAAVLAYLPADIQEVNPGCRTSPDA